MPFSQTFGSMVQGASGAAISMGKPSDIQNNDVLVAIVNSASNGAVASIGGFTNKSNRTTTNRAGSQNLLWHRVTDAASEPATYDTNAAGGILWGFVIRIRGCIETGDPFDGTPALNDSTNGGTTKTCGAISPGSANDLAVAAYCQLDASATHGSYSDTGGIISPWTQGANGTTANTRNSTASGVDPTTGSLTPQMVSSANGYTFMYAFALRAGGAGVTVDVTGVAATPAAGAIGVTGDANVALTGAAASASPGTASVKLRTGVSLEGVAGTGGPGEIGARGAASAPASGVASSAAIGDPAAHISALVTVSGVDAAGHEGEITVAISGGATAAPEGVQANAAAGLATARGAASAVPSGAETGSAAGDIEALTGTIAAASGAAAIGAAGSPAAIAAAQVIAQGVAASGALGPLSAVVRLSVAVPSVSATGAPGTIEVIGTANVPLTGVQAQAVLGILAAIGTGAIAPTGNTVTIDFEDRTSEIPVERRTVIIAIERRTVILH